MLLYTKYKDWLSSMKEQYAYFCGADYILYENDDEFKELEVEIEKEKVNG